MSRTATINKVELNQIAALATAKNVMIEIVRNGTTIRVSPHQMRPAVDESEESALDRELEAFKVKNGYS
ncbi:hypothetical protein [Pararhizobium sp. DWP3-4]|uniref:hypothetical protein n=1 Tax=Pararhizobium sp. DWP3-4 TaxID=2804565 RepID=UPI003CFAAADC